MDWVKLNVDGNMISESGFITAGGVIRDHKKNWLGGFTLYKGIGNVLETELRGLFEGLQIVWKAGYRRINVEIDSLTTVKHLSKPKPINHLLCSLIQSCKSFIEEDWCCYIRHIYREINKVVDCLARLGHCLDFGVT
ncbi:hypothetical protein Ddye_029198 [Dipteronia dyeriana]|uniref:RNase H type-1 domain-containing protein n=1 Tax=Dipteronia dyeriana TaxID=168575 RepID=A0AAD9TEC2_9ROSI|nr:hypothetical protein Ddye_029198 [Dipteronia dyeriana]